MRTKNLLLGSMWVLLYVFLCLTPVIVLLLGAKFSGRPPLLDFSVSLGFVGLAVMALQFVSSARIKILNEPFGTDLVYQFHRQIGIAAFFMVFAHPILLFILDARYLRLLNLLTADWRIRYGVIAVILLIAVVWMAEYRQKLKIPYWFWKFWHGIIATAMVTLALLHIYTDGSYLDMPWKKGVWIGYSALFVITLMYTRIIYPLRLFLHPFTISKIRQERGGVWTLVMKSVKGKSFRFSPGQFAWLTAWKTPFSDSEHPFSLASSSEKTDSIEMSIKNLGPFTSKIQKLKAGAKVYVDGPYGSFSIDRYPQIANLVLIPGGIGITPIMSMLRSMADRADKRPIKLFYSNQTWDSVTFREEIETLQKRLNMQVIYTIERPPENWRGEAGFLNSAILKKYIPPEWLEGNTEVFLCGPGPMMNAVEKALAAAGFAQKNIHTERFALG